MRASDRLRAWTRLAVCALCVAHAGAARAGESLRVVRVGIAGVPPEMERALAPLVADAARHETLSAARIERGVERVLAYLDAHGYPYAVVRPDVLLADSTGAEIVLRVDTGPAATIGPVAVAGARVTSLATVRRLAALDEGAPYTTGALDEARERLARSGLFRSVAIAAPLDSATDGRVPVRVAVSEPRYNSAQGVLSFVGHGQGVAGLVDVALGNVGGRGSDARARWQKQGAGLSEFDLRYHVPWIAGLPVGAGARVAQLVQDTLYTRTDASLAADVTHGARTDGALGVAYTRGVAGTVGAARSTTVAGTLHLRYVSTPGREIVQPGVRVVLDGSAGSRHDEIRGAVTRRLHAIGGGEAEARVSLGGARLGVLRATGRAIAVDAAAAPVYELLYVGGAQSLRGYRERQFAGTGVATLTGEVRWLIDAEGSRVEVFVDAGRIVDATRADGAVQRPVGYGLGVWTRTGNGLVGIDYGVPRGGGALDGLLHVTLRAEF